MIGLNPALRHSPYDGVSPVLTEELLVAAPWRYGKDGEEPFTDGLRFLPEGGIGGFDHGNERSWAIETGALVLRGVRGEVTARFAAIEAQRGLVVLRAPYEPYAQDAALFFILRLEREITRPSAPMVTGPAAELTDKELVERFESLGHDCEFGLLQRAFGAEPMGLMRWGGTHVVYLIEMLERNFAGLGDPASCEIVESKGELYLVDRRYHLTRHTFTKPTPDVDHAKLFQQHLSFFDFLKKAFVETLEDGELMFVFKDFDNMGRDMVLELSRALRRYGPAKVMVVHQHGIEGAAPTLELVSEHAWLGHIDRFGQRDGAWQISRESWTTLLRMVLAQAG